MRSFETSWFQFCRTFRELFGVYLVCLNLSVKPRGTCGPLCSCNMHQVLEWTDCLVSDCPLLSVSIHWTRDRVPKLLKCQQDNASLQSFVWSPTWIRSVVHNLRITFLWLLKTSPEGTVTCRVKYIVSIVKRLLDVAPCDVLNVRRTIAKNPLQSHNATTNLESTASK